MTPGAASETELIAVLGRPRSGFTQIETGRSKPLATTGEALARRRGWARLLLPRDGSRLRRHLTRRPLRTKPERPRRWPARYRYRLLAALSTGLRLALAKDEMQA
jgi:hypothetical protein